MTATAAAGEHLAQCIQGSGHQPVVRPFAALRSFEQAGLDQDLEVMRHRGLGMSDRRGQLAHTCLGAGVACNQRHAPQPGRFGQRLEYAGRSAATASSTPLVIGLQHAATSAASGEWSRSVADVIVAGMAPV